jgi:hypothetical protein
LFSPKYITYLSTPLNLAGNKAWGFEIRLESLPEIGRSFHNDHAIEEIEFASLHEQPFLFAFLTNHREDRSLKCG